MGRGLYRPIPPCMSRLTRLTVLDINENNICGTLSPLQGLTSLVSMHAAYTYNINGTLAPLQNMKMLEVLEVSHNKLE